MNDVRCFVKLIAIANVHVSCNPRKLGMRPVSGLARKAASESFPAILLVVISSRMVLISLSAADRSPLVLLLYNINAECMTLVPTLLNGGLIVVLHSRVSSCNFIDAANRQRQSPCYLMVCRHAIVEEKRCCLSDDAFAED
jgi:hypothetical protein